MGVGEQWRSHITMSTFCCQTGGESEQSMLLCNFGNTATCHHECKHLEKYLSHASTRPWIASIWCRWREGMEKDAQTSVSQDCSSLTAILLAFQTPDVRMAVIRCFKTVTQSHSLQYSPPDLKFCTPLRMLLPTRKVTSVIWLMVESGQGQGVKISENWGRAIRASRDVIASGGPDLVRMWGVYIHGCNRMLPWPKLWQCPAHGTLVAPLYGKGPRHLLWEYGTGAQLWRQKNRHLKRIWIHNAAVNLQAEGGTEGEGDWQRPGATIALTIWKVYQSQVTRNHYIERQ